jgi:ABC-type proline/glycine betaine transport system permease subunit
LFGVRPGDGAQQLGLQQAVPLIALLTIPIEFGSAPAIPTITALLLNSVPPERAGTASGVQVHTPDAKHWNAQGMSSSQAAEYQPLQLNGRPADF